MVLSLLLSVLLFSRRFQNKVLNALTDSVEEHMDGELSFSSVRIVPFNIAVISDVLVTDSHPVSPDYDTVAFFSKIKASFTLRGLLSRHGLEISRLEVEGGILNMAAEPPGNEAKSNIHRVFHLPPYLILPEEAPDIFRFKKTKISNFRFTAKDFGKYSDYSYSGVGINWDDIDIVIDTDIRDLAFSDMIMSGAVDRLTAVEKSGYVISECSGRAVVGRGKTTITDLLVKDSFSEIHMPLFRMSYADILAFEDFPNAVTIEADFSKSLLAMNTVSRFTGSTAGSRCAFDIRAAEMKGTISDFSVNGLDFTETLSGIRGNLDLSIDGMPDIARARFYLQTRDLIFSMRSLSTLIDAMAGPGTMKPGIGGNAGFNLRCKVEGSLDDLSADAFVRGSAGNAIAHASAKNISDPLGSTTIEGYASTYGLDIGKILGIKEIGVCDASLSASAELIEGNPRISLDSILVNRISLSDHDFHNIYGKGGYGKMGPFGTLLINDRTLKMVATGERMSYSVSVPEIDLFALGIDKRDSVSKASFSAGINFYKDSCNLAILGLKLTDRTAGHETGPIHAVACRDGASQSIRISSAFADADAGFSRGVADFVKDIRYLTARKELPALYTDVSENRSPADCRISVRLSDTREILSFLLPDLKVSENTTAELSIENSLLNCRVLSGNVSWKNVTARNLALSADNSGDRISLGVNSEEIIAAGITLNNASIGAYADDNSFSAQAQYCGAADSLNKGYLSINGRLLRTDDDSLAVHAHINESEIILSGEKWTISPSDIEYSSGALDVGNLSIASGIQSIEAKGGIRRSDDGTFSLSIKDLDLAALNSFLKIPPQLGGRLNGGAILLSPVADRLHLAMNVRSDSVLLAGTNVGAFSAGSAWDDKLQRLNLVAQHFNGKRRTLDVKAFFVPSSKEISAVAEMDNFELKAAEPLLSGIATGIGGNISGKIRCEGTLDNPAVFSDGTTLNDVSVCPVFTGVPYTVNGAFSVEKENLSFDSLTIRDSEGGEAHVSGTVSDFFNKPALYAELDLSGLRVLDIDESRAESVYGRLSVSGDATASGTFNSLFVDGSISTSGPGEIHIPLNSALTQNSNELLTFEEKKTDSFLLFEDKPEVVDRERNNVTARAKLRISPEVTAYAEIDKSSGNLISAFGEGDIELDLNAERNSFQINGDYLLRGGNYRFAIPGLIGKDLSISDGSSIKFSGDLMDTQLDLNAVYSLKTSIAPLTADSTSVSSRRQVNCTLSITDRLRNPSIGFGVDIPDLDPMTKAQVQTALNTEDKIQKQFISLLLLSSFIPSESSGIVNANSNMLYANMAEMMSGQVNSILQKLEIPLDLGFGYQVGDAGTDIFDVAVSTQLFNNRVIVGGSVGNRKYSTSTSANGDVVGDLDIEVKIDRSGQFRFKLFSHSADEFTSFLDYTQRNGAGVTYQREFGREKASGRNDNEFLKRIVIDGKRLTDTDSGAAGRQ